MKSKFQIGLRSALMLALLFSAAMPALAGPKKSNSIARDPYLGALVIDGTTGQILFADNPDQKAYPASVLKLMNLLIILEKIKAGALTLEDKVLVTAEASRIGGSQVYLKENETFAIDELLYAMIVQSANDAATALAIHIAGSKQGFVELMNQRARELGMKATEFHSVHGLPPGRGQKPDVSTPRDLARLARELLKHPEALRYTATRERSFRNGSFIMRSHNHLLGKVEGCDGLKTGYFSLAGFSSVVTARRGGERVIAVVMGSPSRTSRDAKAAELLAKGFLLMPRKEIAAAQAGKPPAAVAADTAAKSCPARCPLGKTGLLLAGLAVAVLGLIYFRRRRSER